MLSYSGFFAAERLYEVKPADAKEADETAQTYFVPESELERYLPDEFVYDSETGQRKSYEKGSFIFRLAGRDREKSASYYTPEVLTQCVVKYSLKELLKDKTADDILKITICEPAMGSGAFINEALNQLADAYLERKQKELGKRISPDDYRTERQKVKYFLAVNNAYGVDLNPTAVRLAEVSLWLNILYPDAPTPWFGARLATGNSLIGARRQVYTAEDVKSGAYTSQAPTACPLAPETHEDREAGRIRPRPEGTIYHWLLPDAGMAAFDSDKVIKELAPTEVEAIKKWRKEFTKPFNTTEIKNLLVLSDQADVLWQKVLDERQRFLENTRQPTPVWGQPQNATASKISIEQREKELAWLQRSTGPYARLKLAMDYWCALWFWPIPDATKLPTRKQFIDDLADIFAAGDDSGFEGLPEQLNLFDKPNVKQLGFGQVKSSIPTNLVHENPRIALAQQVAEEQHFHHWEIAYPEIFAQRFGFDLIIGNPPWVKITWDESGLLSDFMPVIAIRKMIASEISSHIMDYMTNREYIPVYFWEFSKLGGLSSYVNSTQNYPQLIGIQSNSYKCFIIKSLEIGSKEGIIGFLHPEGIYDDSKGGSLRTKLYQHLCAHFMFQNELLLFQDIGDRVRYSVNIYRVNPSQEINFDHISNLYHPSTVDASYSHDGYGIVPGIKNFSDQWDLRGHKDRIIHFNITKLYTISLIFYEGNQEVSQTRLPIIHSTEILVTLEKFSRQKNKLGDYTEEYSSSEMWHETNSQKDGTIKRSCSIPMKLEEWIVSGPHINVATPFNKNPNEGCKSKGDYTDIDLTIITDDYLPRTVYVPSCDQSEYIARTSIWGGKKITEYYRHVARSMLSQAGERTFVGCLVPKHVGHINSLTSFCFRDQTKLVLFSGLSSSIAYDFFIKSSGKQNLHELPKFLPFPTLDDYHNDLIIARTLRLNCITSHYAELWKNIYKPSYSQDRWSKDDPRLNPWGGLTSNWVRSNALRTPFERRQALIELDVLVALAIDLSLDEFISVYRVQFPVLQKYDRLLLFDQRGMEVPVKSVSGELGPDENHPKFPEMVPPFTPVDREDDYRVAWKFFDEKLQNEQKSANLGGHSA